MDKKYFADRKYSKKLAWMFPDALYRWHPPSNHYKEWFPAVSIKSDGSDRKLLPAIHFDMVLEKLPKGTEINKLDNFTVWSYGKYTSDKKPSNALCKMLEWLVDEGIIKKI